MRILCVDGPYFQRALAAQGHQTLCIGSSPGVDVPLSEPLSLSRLLETLKSKDFVPDAMLWADTCQPPTVIGLELLPWPSVAYSIDQYMNPWHVAYSSGFDTVLVAQKEYLGVFASEHFRPARWMPLFCDPAHDNSPEGERDIPVSFVGTLDSPANPGRKVFLDAFKKQAPLVALSGDYRPVFGRSRIVLNQSAAGELNFRLFQAAACGAAVLTEATGNGLAELFTPGENVLVYERANARSAAQAALAALNDPRLPDIALAGRQEVLSKHTVDVRAAEITAILQELRDGRVHERRIADSGAIRARMSNAYRVLALDEALPLPPGHRRFYLELAFRNDPAYQGQQIVSEP
jgi:hypothetical protein